MTAVTKATWGADGVLTTLTYQLPSQTTPFAPPRQQGDQGTGMPDRCSISVFCRNIFYADYSSLTAANNPTPLSGQQCMGAQPTVQSDTSSNTNDDATDWDSVGFDETCWPENYFALFDNEWGTLNGAASSSADTGDAATAAFPGNQCLAGWTTACTTTITAGASPLLAYYPQAWCCPPGQWSCASGTGESGGDASQRLCKSVLTGTAQTEVWMSWDPPFRTSGAAWTEAYTWKAPVAAGATDPAAAAVVFRKVFPLVLSSSGGGGLGVGRAVETAAPVVLLGREETMLRRDEAQRVSLSRQSAVAGFLGATVATLVMWLLGFALWRRARRGEGRRSDTITAAMREDGKYDVEVVLPEGELKLA